MFSLSQCELDHDNEVTCVDLDREPLRVASGTVDGEHRTELEGEIGRAHV